MSISTPFLKTMSLPLKHFYLLGVWGRKTLPRGCLPNLNDTSLRYVPMTVADGVRVMSRLSEGP